MSTSESSVVRTIYLYLMCLVGIAVVAVGLVGTVQAVTHTIAPDLGHRDTIDRVGIGLSNVAGDVLGILEDSERADVEDFCDRVSDNDTEFDECVDESLGVDDMDAIQDGIASVRSELRSQIRKNSIDGLIRGLVSIGIGVLLFGIHSRRTDVFRDGLFPKRRTPVAVPSTPGPALAGPAASGPGPVTSPFGTAEFPLLPPLAPQEPDDGEPSGHA